MTCLPDEVLSLIIQRVDFRDKCSLQLVCRAFNKVLSCPTPGAVQLWGACDILALFGAKYTHDSTSRCHLPLIGLVFISFLLSAHGLLTRLWPEAPTKSAGGLTDGCWALKASHAMPTVSEKAFEARAEPSAWFQSCVAILHQAPNSAWV